MSEKSTGVARDNLVAVASGVVRAVTGRGVSAAAMEKTDALLNALIHGIKIDVDATDLESLDGCEKLITGMANVRRISGIAIALAFIHIRDHRLYPAEMEWSAYKTSCKERLGIHPSDVWRYEKIGDTYVTHHHELDKIGFSERGDATKLMFLTEAIVKHKKGPAFRAFGEMSTVEFANWTKGKAARIPYKGREFGVTEEALLYNHKEVISFEAIRDIEAAGKLEELKRAVAALRK